MSNPVVATIRSVVQAVVALGVVAIGNLTLMYLDLTINVAALTETVSLFEIGLLVWAFNKAGEQWPWINQILSLGQAKAPAEYSS